MLIVFIGLDITKNEFCLDPFPSKSYMGFGYNPNLDKFGERLDLLNFFAWFKRLQSNSSVYWYIYDASSYFIVNRISPNKIAALGERPSGESILNVLLEEQKRPKRQDILTQIKSNMVRDNYISINFFFF